MIPSTLSVAMASAYWEAHAIPSAQAFEHRRSNAESHGA